MSANILYATREELINARVKILKSMDTYIRNNIDDEDVFDWWLAYGVPDDADDDMLYDIAAIDNCWLCVVKCFAEIIKIENGEVE